MVLRFALLAHRLVSPLAPLLLVAPSLGANGANLPSAALYPPTRRSWLAIAANSFSCRNKTLAASFSLWEA